MATLPISSNPLNMLRLRLWLGFALALFCLWLASWKFHPPPAPSPRLFVFQSSAAPRGRGLYAGRELAAEEALGQYPGMILSDSQRTRLSTVLHRNAESFLDKERVIFSPSFLLAKLNFSVVGDAIDWAALLKSFEAYLFAFLGSDHKLNFITWMKFDAAGNAVIDTTEENLMLFVNEPPKAEFLNVISGKMQPAEPNVQSK